METDDKKAIGIVLLAVLGGISWYLVDLIPTLEWTGRSIALLILITGVVVDLVEYLIKKYTGATKGDLPLEVTITDTTYDTTAFDLDMSDEPDEED